MVKLLSKEDILGLDDFTTQDVEVPEWGGIVRVKALSGTERDLFEGSIAQRKGKQTTMNMTNIRAKLVSLAVIDEKGKKLFKDSDIVALGQKSASALDRVFDVAMELAGMRDEDIDELTENFPSALNGHSTSS